MTVDARVANHHRRTAGILDAVVLLPAGGDRGHGRTVLRGLALGAGERSCSDGQHDPFACGVVLRTRRTPIVLRSGRGPCRVRARRIMR